MELSRKSCRLCLTETDFNVSLYSNYCRKTNMIDKILVCLKIVIEESDSVNTICYKCANNVEKYYDFINYVKRSQTKLASGYENRQRSLENSPNVTNRRHVTSYVREQVIDADYTFSFVENGKEKKEHQASSPFFSYFSPPDALQRREQPNETWKSPRTVQDIKKDNFKRPRKEFRHKSRDLFDSQSQDLVEEEPKSLDWKLTPDENILKRIRDKCFGRSDFFKTC